MDNWNDVGSGSPYAGSGFVNFDRFMQPENIAWGAAQTPIGTNDSGWRTWESPQTDWSLKSPYDEWMINLGYKEPPPAPPAQEETTVEEPQAEAPPQEPVERELYNRNDHPYVEGVTPPKYEPNTPVPSDTAGAYYGNRNEEDSAFPTLDNYLGNGRNRNREVE